MRTHLGQVLFARIYLPLNLEQLAARILSLDKQPV